MDDNIVSTTKYKTLYKVDTKGKIREWNIWIDHYEKQSIINVSHGAQDGAKQLKTTTISKGKNIGKSNETTPAEQSKLEAESKISKQLDKQYSLEIKYEKEFRPMLAHKYAEQSHKIKYPAYVSRKSDGLRCFIQKVGDDIIPSSRNGKQYKVLGHITKSLEPFFIVNPSITLDGELYIHGEEFEKIVGAIKRDDPNELTSKIEFHIYDCYDSNNEECPFKDRLDFIRNIKFDHVKLLDSFEVNTEEEINIYRDKFINEGYEGLMIRNNSAYEQKRSYNLQKVKQFDDHEFLIVGYRTDKNDECVFVCASDAGEFECKPKGEHEYRKSLADSKYVGKWLRIEHFGYTNKGVPRFPIGLQIIDNKDDLH